jgi:thiamine-phosphate pyrophosphorylase
MIPPLDLYYITDRKALGGRKLVSVVAAAARGGVDGVQIREKDLPTGELVALVREALDAIRGAQTRLIVNDRLDVAMALDASGVHLGTASLPVREARRVAPAGFLIGASCHSVEEVMTAEAAGANYVLLGPIYSTPSKVQYGPPLGVEKLREAVACVGIPVLALGGITVERARECRAAGAAGIAAIRLFQEAESLEELARELRSSEAP